MQQSRHIPTNGIALHVLEAGPADGPLVILLHGFPETSEAWRETMTFLAERGLRVIAADLRGYGRSDKPAGRRPFAIEELGKDVLGIIAAMGRSRAMIVGHDWGGVVAWWLAANHPEVFERAVILNVPHPTTFRRRLYRDPLQMIRSSYMFTFQIPWLPEKLICRNRCEPMIRALQKSANPGAFSAELLESYRHAWSQPRGMTGMLASYRGTLWSLFRTTMPRIIIPVLVLWGVKDQFMSVKFAEASLEFCDNAELVKLPDATHWLHHEEPERVNTLIGDFLTSV